MVIECARHGSGEICYACLHLVEGSDLGYYAMDADDESPAQAWCESCDVILEQEQGWTDLANATADWKLICQGCYEETLARHQFLAWTIGTDSREP